jgi:hypothetical protein
MLLLKRLYVIILSFVGNVFSFRACDVFMS